MKHRIKYSINMTDLCLLCVLVPNLFRVLQREIAREKYREYLNDMY